jgi:hypothetical protein
MKKKLTILFLALAVIGLLASCVSGPSVPVKKATSKIEAELFDKDLGTQPEKGGDAVGYIDEGDYMLYKNVDFGAGVSKMTAMVANNSGSRHIILKLDSLTGPQIGVLAIENTGDWNGYEEMSCDIKDAKGVHDLYLVAQEGETELGNIDWFTFN